MSEVHQLPNAAKVEREASDWIARLNADDVSAEDRTRFEAWRAAHPLHARIYLDILGTWNRFTVAGPLVRAVSFAQSMNEAGVARAPWRLGVLAAAGASLAIFVAISYFYEARLAPSTAYQTATGEHASFALRDGSVMELNSNSVARVQYTKATRVIRLERGEAFFRVAHDTQRPFWVVGGGTWVRAVGTAFDVNLRPADVVVTVSEGTVKVGADDPSFADAHAKIAPLNASLAVLTAGQQANLRHASVAMRSLSSSEIEHSVSWREGTLYFENQPLKEVIAELSRYTALKIHIEDEDLNDLLVGGTFQANPQGSEAMLTMLQQGFGLTVHRDGDKAFIETTSTRHQK